ncbi:Replication termination factor 2 [Elasticomyces elasticus]|nr:Replication termination factor 2 [Elasticomyces elasticus]
MGNDGGSIPTRRELVKEAARDPTTTQIREIQHEQTEYYWTTDPISRNPLVRPLVSDSLGKLYNKDTILEYLLGEGEEASKSEADGILQGNVKALRDVVEVKFEVDKEATEKGDGSVKVEVWKCPITNDRLGSGTKSVYLVPCGHAFSARAIKEVARDVESERCLQCSEPYASNDVIPIIPTNPTEIARLALRMKTLKAKGLSHSLKKASGAGKKRKKDKTEGKIDANGHASRESPKASGIKNASTAALAAKVLQEQEQNKRRRMDNDNLKSLFTSRDQTKPSGNSNDFMTRGYTIPAGAKR